MQEYTVRKALFIILVLLLANLCLADITSNLTLHWLLDEGKDSTATDSADSYDGTVVEATWVTGYGGNGYALSFDGSNDHVTNASDPIDTGADSASMWIYPIGWGEASLGYMVYNGKFRFYLNGGSATLRFSSDDGAHYVDGASSVLSLSSWQFVCVTRDAAGAANLYVSGSLTGDADQDSGTPASGGAIFVAGDNATNYRAFYGYIDDVRIYARELSGADVAELYASYTTAHGNIIGGGIIGLTIWEIMGEWGRLTALSY